ncbi:MAG: energy transducer TonB [Burkholderiaceae bacterium]|nr:energy transducer TonB [Burkholderiaceae bacterium]
MHYSQLEHKHSRIQFSIFFIAALMLHIAVIQSIGLLQHNSRAEEENISFLELFEIQAEDTILTADESHNKDALTEPEDIKIPQDLIPKKIKPSPTTRNVNAINPGKDNSQTHITPPIAHANVLNNPPPFYPRQSRRRGEQGKVVLAAEIASNGRALQALVNISSGYPRLDQAALESVLKWRFIPGKKSGIPQVMWINIPINFVLE